MTVSARGLARGASQVSLDAPVAEMLAAALPITFLAGAIFSAHTEHNAICVPPSRFLCLTSTWQPRSVAQKRGGAGRGKGPSGPTRTGREDPSFHKAAEDEIVWGELLDLELQDFDEQLNRICQTAGDASDRQVSSE